MTNHFKALSERLKRLEPHRFDSAHYRSGSLPRALLSETERSEHDARSELKQGLLNHYAERDPSSFFQFDAFTDVEADEYMLGPDDEGDSVMSSVTHELMSGTYAVRVLVTPGTSPEQTCALLGKIAEAVAKDGFEFHNDELERQIDAREASHNRSDADRKPLSEYTVLVRAG